MPLRTDYSDGSAVPAPTNITAADMNAISAAANAAATLTGTQTLTNKTLTTPIINDPTMYAIKGNTTGADVVRFNDNTSAVNYLQLHNRATGAGPMIEAVGPDTDINLMFVTKAGGALVYYMPSGSTAVLIIDGGAADIDLNLDTKGSGKVRANSVEVATISDIQTLTNKTVTSPILGGTATGTYTLAGTPTITSPTVSGLTTTDGIAKANIPNGLTNANVARQSQTAATNTSYYVTSSNLNLPATLKAGMAVGTRFTWRVHMDKTAVGTGTFSIIIYRGTNGSTSDTADVTQSIGTQSAVADNMVVDVSVVVTTTGASGAYYWTICPMQRAATVTGFGVATGTTGLFSGTVSAVAMNTASLIFGLGFRNGTPGTPVISVPMVQAQAFNIC